MAQLVLTLAGSSLGNAIGGGLGGSLVALMGSMAGAVIDQELFGPPAARRKVKGARVSDIRLSGSAFGLGIPMVYGRGRLPANVIWARGIREEVRTTTERVGGSGGKGGIGGGSGRRGGETVTTTSYHYFADVALGIGEGPVTSIYRIWVDGQPLDPEHVGELRLYYGDEGQLPDPLIQAVEGVDRTPAHRGLAYVVLDNLYVTPFGNRFPNFEVEVFRGSGPEIPDARHLVQGVCLIPASGEWAYDPELAFTTRHKPPSAAPGAGAALNAHSGQKRADFAVAIDNLDRELPNVEWISLVYAWFGTSTDLAACTIRPEAEVGVYQDQWPDTRPEPWTVMGVGRPIFGPGGAALPIPHWPTVSSYTKPDGSLGLYYGGTIADAAMVRAIQHLRARGYKVLFYPFLMMDVPPPDPAPFPWRGRITGAAAGVAGFFERPDGYGGAIRLVAIEQELTLTGAFVDATTATIADRMIVLAVASRTTQAITGATSYSVGVAGNTSQFGGSLGTTLGSSNIGVIGPTAFYANTPVRVTAAGGNFTGGKVRVLVYALAFAAPTG